MGRFSFDHFPEEHEIIDDAEEALMLQMQHGAGKEITEAIIRRAMEAADEESEEDKGELLTKSLEIDYFGIESLSKLYGDKVRLKDMTEEEREAISMLWVNYMCEQEYGAIPMTMFRLVTAGVDYRQKGMEITNRVMNKEEMDDHEYSGTIIYMWTMINVIRSMKKSLRGRFDLPPSNVFHGISMN